MPEIIVGMDESDGAAQALRWTVGASARRGWTIRAVLAWDLLDQHPVDPTDAFDPGYDDEAARRALAAAIERAVGPDSASHIGLEVVCDLPAPALVERSAAADLLVVGARGLGGFKSLLLGSVSDHCVRHASCPVAVVRADGRTSSHTTERVVVGVDGSPTARRALRWAVELARPVHAEVEVVHAWQPAVLGGPFAPVAFENEWEEAAERVLDEAIAAEDTAGVQVTRTLARDGAAHTILVAAQDADLVVVGSRGRGGFAGLLLGSVSNQVVHHAHCPVVVVPPDGPRQS